MAEKLAKRFEGHEVEILRDIRLYGSMSAMMRWGASYISWSKYVIDLEAKYGNSKSLSVVDRKVIEKKDNVTVQSIHSVIPLRITVSGGRSLAQELVEEFTSQVVRLKTENDRLNSRVQELELALEVYRTGNDEKLADKVIEALEVIKR